VEVKWHNQVVSFPCNGTLTTLPCKCFLPNFSSFEIAVSEEKIFKKSTNQKQELPVAAMFVNESELNDQSLWKVLYKDFSFHPDSLTDMAATGYSCF
jgi:hypothetical protein